MIIIWVALLIGLFLFVPWLSKGRGTDRGNPLLTDSPPLDILKRRYARGEINREEYLEKQKDLN